MSSPTFPSFQILTAVADRVARGADLPAAFDSLITGLARALDTRASLFQKVSRGWTLVTQVRGGLQLSVSDLHMALGTISPDESTAIVDLRSIGEGLWTSVPLNDSGGPSIVVLLAGDWTVHKGALDSFAVVLSFALRSVHEREIRRRAERLSFDAYAMGRRLSRLGDLEVVGERIVSQVSRSLKADRVALALYRPEEDRLIVAATHGYSVTTVKDVRIEPGSWVVGHVFASGRPVLVPDTRQLTGMAAGSREYRTFSFAAVPMFAGTETVGVLTATDKRDGSAFDTRDAAALRTFSVSASLALVAARSDTEVHRLSFAATLDSLTGLFNRPYLDARLHQEVERARRGSSSLTVLLADIDDFKTINDTYGHQTGDAVLRMVGTILRSTVRVFDVCARYGGDEFAILMPTSDRSTAAACAERIRQHVSEAHDGIEEHPHLPPLTLSIGVAVIETGDAPADIIRRADQCLYQAKGEGKNRVCVNLDGPGSRQTPLSGRNANNQV
jgi:two-component system cell cycle response regulator